MLEWRCLIILMKPVFPEPAEQLRKVNSDFTIDISGVSRSCVILDNTKKVDS